MYKKNVATQKLHSTTMHKIQFRRYVEDISWRLYHEQICVEFGLVAYSISLFVWIITSRKVKNGVAHNSNEQQIQAASELGVQ